MPVWSFFRFWAAQRWADPPAQHLAASAMGRDDLSEKLRDFRHTAAEGLGWNWEGSSEKGKHWQMPIPEEVAFCLWLSRYWSLVLGRVGS